MKIFKCTFTGVDTEVSKKDIELISNDYKYVEWGYLYSPVRAGTPGRYMSSYRIEDHLKTLPQNVNTALHICGKGVTDFIFLEKGYHENLIELIKEREGRVQINFNFSRDTLDLYLLANRIKSYSSIVFIIQENKSNSGVIDSLLRLGATNVSALFDSSGGRGIPGKWRAPFGIPCGYAGGLGPDNIGKELIAINKVVGDQPIWIDMESNIRQAGYNNTDFMNLECCEQVLKTIQNSQFI